MTRTARAPKPRAQRVTITITFGGDAYAAYDAARALLDQLGPDPRFTVLRTEIR